MVISLVLLVLDAKMTIMFFQEHLFACYLLGLSGLQNSLSTLGLKKIVRFISPYTVVLKVFMEAAKCVYDFQFN